MASSEAIATLLVAPVEIRVLERRCLFLRWYRVVSVRPFRLRDLPVVAPLLPLLKLTAAEALVKRSVECGMLLLVATELSPRELSRLTPESLSALVDTVWALNADIEPQAKPAKPKKAARRVGSWTVTEVEPETTASGATLGEVVEYLVSAGHPLQQVLDYTLSQIRVLYDLAQRRAVRESLVRRQAEVIDAAVAASGDRNTIRKHTAALAAQLKKLS